MFCICLCLFPMCVHVTMRQPVWVSVSFPSWSIFRHPLFEIPCIMQKRLPGGGGQTVHWPVVNAGAFQLFTGATESPSHLRSSELWRKVFWSTVWHRAVVYALVLPSNYITGNGAWGFGKDKDCDEWRAWISTIALLYITVLKQCDGRERWFSLTDFSRKWIGASLREEIVRCGADFYRSDSLDVRPVQEGAKPPSLLSGPRSMHESLSLNYYYYFFLFVYAKKQFSAGHGVSPDSSKGRRWKNAEGVREK